MVLLITPLGAGYYAGGVLERIAAILALVLVGAAVYFVAAVALGVVNRSTIEQFTKRPG